jgi:GT2 family glycosyltransferase
MRVSFVMPTRNRSEVLHETLKEIGALQPEELPEACDLLVVDNASERATSLPSSLPNGIEIRLIRLETNLNTAARNVAAEETDADWLIMLDDDSSPMRGCDWSLLKMADESVGAIGGEIWLPDGRRESGGLPEVIVGCGCALRRKLFLQIGGYDETFGFYAEEYGVCGELIRNGYRVLHSAGLQFEHRKSTVGRDFDEIVYRLVRNNAWIMHRYAPDDQRQQEIENLIDRYGAISVQEHAEAGFRRGVDEVHRTLPEQPRTPMSSQHWDRFTGRAAVRSTIREDVLPSDRVRIIGGPNAKGRGTIEQELKGHGVDLCSGPESTPFIGSLSPGPMLDLQDAHPNAIAPWSVDGALRSSP